MIHFILLPLLSLSMVFNDSEKYTYHSECGYTTNSIEMYNIDSVVETYISNYGQFKQELVDTINFRERSDSSDIKYTADQIGASDIYEFESESDLMILKYSTPYGIFFFAGYVKSTGSWFPLFDTKGNEIEINFNKILGLCPHLRQAPLLCKSAILLGLKYIKPENSILYDMDDIAGVCSFGMGSNNKPADSVNFSSAAALYILNISADTVYNRYFQDGFFHELKAAFDEDRDSFTHIPPQIRYGVSQDTVELTLFNTYYGELAEWQLIYNKEGYLVHMDFISKPKVTIFRWILNPSGSKPAVRKYGKAPGWGK